MKTPKSSQPFRVLFAILCALIAISLISKWFAPRDIIPWRTDFTAAQKEAAATHKPLLAYFTATWCGPCQDLKRTTWSNQNVEHALRAYVPVKIDIDEHPDLATKYSPESIPTFVTLDENGTALKTHSGALHPGEFLTWLNRP